MEGGHAAHRLPGTQERPDDVHREHPGQSLGRHLIDPLGAVDDSGGVDQRRHRTEGRLDRLEQANDLRLVADVGRHRLRLHPNRPARARYGTGRFGIGSVAHAHVPPPPGEEYRGGGADPSAAPRHHRHPAHGRTLEPVVRTEFLPVHDFTGTGEAAASEYLRRGRKCRERLRKDDADPRRLRSCQQLAHNRDCNAAPQALRRYRLPSSTTPADGAPFQPPRPTRAPSSLSNPAFRTPSRSFRAPRLSGRSEAAYGRRFEPRRGSRDPAVLTAARRVGA